MAWPIAEVARMSGVTARTLRHYDEIGLLSPARIGTNGHRYYEERQLLQRQQILVLRTLGLGLPEIRRILAAQVAELEALRGHRRRLVAERDRLDALAGTVSRTIAELEQSRKDGRTMTSINRPENLFEGVRPTQYGESLRDFPELAEKVEQRSATMSQDEIDAGHRTRTAQMIRLAELQTCPPTPTRCRPRSTPSTGYWPSSGQSPPRTTARSGVPAWRTSSGARHTRRLHPAWPRISGMQSRHTPPPG